MRALLVLLTACFKTEPAQIPLPAHRLRPHHSEMVHRSSRQSDSGAPPDHPQKWSSSAPSMCASCEPKCVSPVNLSRKIGLNRGVLREDCFFRSVAAGSVGSYERRASGMPLLNRGENHHRRSLTKRAESEGDAHNRRENAIGRLQHHLALLRDSAEHLSTERTSRTATS